MAKPKPSPNPNPKDPDATSVDVQSQTQMLGKTEPEATDNLIKDLKNGK